MLLPKKESIKYYKYYGRKVTKKISRYNKYLLEKFYNKYSYDDLILEYYSSKERRGYLELKDSKFNKINIDIGFGDGEFLIKNAITNPNEMFIGSEVYINGIARVLKKIVELDINNIRLSNINSFYLLKALPSKSVDSIYLINPDPWEKKKHHKRRLITRDNIIVFLSAIKSEKAIFITTDSESYVSHIQELSLRNYIPNRITISVLNKGDLLFGISKYQRKAIEKGRKIYLIRI